MTTQAEVQGWAGGLDAVLERIAPRFTRAEPWRRAAAYLRGLLAPVERKNGWQLAEAAGDATPDGVQDVLSRAHWDADAVRDDLQAYMAEHLGDAGAVLVLEETGFLRWAERNQRGYVLAVTSGQRLGLRPVPTWIKGLPKREWQRLSAGDGAKGPRLYDWACVPYSGAAPGFQSALLVRRSIAKPQGLAFYLTHAPERTATAALVRVAGTRWAIRARSSRPRARSASATTRCAPGSAGTGTSRSRCSRSPTLPPCVAQPPEGVAAVNLAIALLPLTVPEIRRLLWHLVWRHPPRPEAALRWSAWRRRHQQRARRAHWHTRLCSMPRSRKLRL